jgi:hypothetical protein
MEVVNYLRENPGKVDGIHSAEFEGLVGIGIAKKRLDNILQVPSSVYRRNIARPLRTHLAVVEGSGNGNVVYIGIEARCHLGFLNLSSMTSQ